MTDVSSKEDLVCSLDGNSTSSKSETLQNTTNTASATASDLSTKVRASPTAGPAHGLGAVVATHYNTLQEKGLDERCKSRIFYLRNFNNWTKSMLINEFMSKLWQLRGRDSELRVMDMCCGKGGDLLKWRRGNISHLVCVDLAATSVEQCRNRYNDLVTRSGSERGFAPVFSAEFIAADCTKTQLKQRYQDSLMMLDLVSCQFAFHYCFESLPQAECMLRNVAECLRPGGFFIGTMPDAYGIVHRLKASGGKEFGNDLYKIEFQCDTERIPLFGAKYDFHLEGVVDCPEFLVHFPTLIKLAEKFGLRLVFKKKFSEYYKQQQEEGRSLLGKMQALETYPPFHESPLLGKIPDDYEHVEQYMQRCMERGHRRVGTLSRSEWEAAALYLVFAFEKQKSAAGMDETQSSGGGSRRSEAEGRKARSDNAAATTS
ncbi:mRNA cap guanine-N7 methyltransferase isoform X2 [Bacillus rossius redtenbacheri]|uniref:mRNA cap guanine-N7 methyltransferase isoform X2 n=1 Tax=Bacillus rossius redtenbacheri TaxID=93214 RepID=UPI002FDE72F5